MLQNKNKNDVCQYCVYYHTHMSEVEQMAAILKPIAVLEYVSCSITFVF